MLHNKFQASEPSDSEEEEFDFSLNFYDSIPGHPEAGPFWNLGNHLNKLGKGPLASATYQISST